MHEKIIRDPVHDVIVFRTDRPVDALLFSLLNSTEVQRLRRIKQLGMASLAYPGADHSRYSHSLGVMETARKIIGRLRCFLPIDEEHETTCLAAALLHDLGHGPFSHVFERVSEIHHEDSTRRLIEDPESHIHRRLAAHEPTLPARIITLLSPSPTRTIYHDILSSQLDADRFDYLLRDNLMTGSHYGGFDLAWLIQALTPDDSSHRLAITWKGISAAEDYLQSRYHMYRNVYFHKVVRSAEGMVKLALQRARRLAIQDRLPWPPRENDLHKSLLGQSLSTSEFIELDDIAILQCFKLWSKGEDQTLARICHGLLYRNLYKVIDISALDPPSAAESYDKARQAVQSAGGDPDYDLFLDSTSLNPTPNPTPNPPADTTQDSDSQGFYPPDGILVCDRAGKATDFASHSPLVEALNRQLPFRRIHIAEPYRERVVAALA